ncbi:MAG: mucoidy inhibitor MuiA family protein [Spirochaetes bacterium]|nr:MAG: mucoidy inhibitor MuiA family protein [Spirochaetota bacterium]
MKNALILALCLSALLIGSSLPAPGAEETVTGSEISSVKLYQNQALITRQARLSLKKGENTVVLAGLPSTLHDWSAKGALPKDFAGKIMSIEVEQKALLSKHQQSVVEIEKKLDALQEKDLEHLHTLKTLQSQEDFLNSIVTFTTQAASQELATRIPQIGVWNDTLNYVSEKRRQILAQRRETEKAREELGKLIQQLEFDLRQIAGYDYFDNYQSLNKAVMDNRASLNVQQFAQTTEKYAEKRRLLNEPTEKIDIEKRFLVQIFSSKDDAALFTFSYLIPDTSWQMLYDVRASHENKTISLLVFANIYQHTGEDWKAVELALSTGSPSQAIRPPVLAGWYLDIGHRYARDIEGASGAADYASSKVAMAKEMKKAKKDGGGGDEEYAPVPEAEVSEKGPFMEIGLPLEQSIASTTKQQKKYVQEYSLKESDKIKFYYEVIPAKAREGFLKVKISNSTQLPWLAGEAQIFLENEFMGKAEVPFTPKGKEETVALGLESRITAQKELVKKYEDTSGLFGGNRRILYTYKITVENQLPAQASVTVVDNTPVSRNEKIKAEVQNLSLSYTKDAEFEKSSDYAQGLRKWMIDIPAHQKKEISYEVVVSFDKETPVQGLR